MEKKLSIVKEACGYLGISKITLYKLINEGKLKPVKLGKITRLKKEDIDRLIKESKQG